MTDLASQINHTVLAAIAPKAQVKKIAGQQHIIASAGPLLPDLLKEFQVTTALRIVHFLAQVAHESDGFCTTIEYASGAAYEGRADLGNTQKGDGPRFRGHGLIQTTGRSNHSKFNSWSRARDPKSPDFLLYPEKLAEFPWALLSAFYYWSSKNLNVLADYDNLVAITKVVNGGTNGLANRAAYLAKAKDIVAELQADNLATNPGDVVLRRGMRGLAVADLQRALRGAGFYHLSIDSIFGPGTEQAVIAFQRDYRLVADGIVGAKTLAQLTRFMPEVAA
ncbi:peptidoglycan-binding protein [Ochrobactrum teleogrylli]|uniref:Peptidoglycan-binding protein n=1 Tax=Ochrobactrum teleogrylli TaxID=2479765 RepID=A0ABY2Y7Q9_9HYPH|nr:peptidoglycan-binding protein [[Ochrobactrum] teleogrylli]TNV17755.1 peptidoglycan-binding protein [[Ochrobactrum] teleogrylli]